MPTENVFTVKPKRLPDPPSLSSAEKFSTPEDLAEAKRRIMPRPRYAVGCFALGIILLVIGSYLFDFLAQKAGSEMGLRPLFIGILITAIIAPLIVTNLLKSIDLEREMRSVAFTRLEATHRAETTAQIESAAMATKQAAAIFSQQSKSVRQLTDLLRNATNSIQLAERLFGERAFTPLWDAVEDALTSLRDINSGIHRIDISVKEYYGLLEGRDHTFPPFPVRRDQIPAIDTVVNSLSEIIGRAHRDFQFASIYEQRKTTSAIIAGFRNMQEAIQGLRKDIVTSISDLEYSLNSGLERIAAEVVDFKEQYSKAASQLQESLEHRHETDTKHQEIVEEALDNIQNRRKPRP